MSKPRKWTRSEIDILVREYPRRPTKDVALFTGHPYGSVAVKAKSLGLKRKNVGIDWKEWMVDMLKKHFSDTPNRLLSEWLEVSVSSLACKAKQLGLSKKGRLYRGKHRCISPEDDAYIRSRIGTESMASIAKAIGFTRCTVAHYCQRNGICRFITKGNGPTSRIHLTPYGEAYLRKHFPNTHNDVLMAATGLSHSTLHRFARQLGLTKTKAFMRKCQRNTTEAAYKANRERGWPPKGYLIPKREANCFKKGVNNLQRLGEKREAERVRKAAASLARTRELERQRAAEGLPQETKLKVTKQPRRKIQLRCYLQKRGYVIEESSSTAFWTDATRRSPHVEASDEGFFKFAKLVD